MHKRLWACLALYQEGNKLDVSDAYRQQQYFNRRLSIWLRGLGDVGYGISGSMLPRGWGGGVGYLRSIPFRGGVVYPVGRVSPQNHKSGRHTSCWNAFLLKFVLIR